MKEQLQLKNQKKKKNFWNKGDMGARTYAVWSAALSGETSRYVYSSAHLNLPLSSQEPGIFWSPIKKVISLGLTFVQNWLVKPMVPALLACF